MKYKIFFDKTVNQLLPFYLSGRKLILFLQSLLTPLQKLNDNFCDWAFETKIIAAMTSQPIMLEWFLNRKFSMFFANPDSKISIEDFPGNSTVIQQETESYSRFILYEESETVLNSTGSTLRNIHDQGIYNLCFQVNIPMNNNNISSALYLKQIQYIINKYNISGKNYIVKIINN